MNAEPNRQDTAEPVVASRSDFIHRLTDQIQDWLEIPYGYQDEAGFHYGFPEWDRDRATQLIRG